MAEGSLRQHTSQAACGVLVGPTAPKVLMGGLAWAQRLEQGEKV